jgi:hypothetical protein
LSPWKYSLKRTLSFQAGSVCSRSTHPKHGPPPVLADEEEGDEPAADILADLRQRQPHARPRRVLERQLVAEVPRVAEERVDDEVVDREPDRPAPVRVAAEHGVVDSAGS